MTLKTDLDLAAIVLWIGTGVGLIAKGIMRWHNTAIKSASESAGEQVDWHSCQLKLLSLETFSETQGRLLASISQQLTDLNKSGSEGLNLKMDILNLKLDTFMKEAENRISKLEILVKQP